MKNEQSIPRTGEPEKLWNKTYIMILILSVFGGAASQMVTPFISKYAISLGAPLTIAATIASLMSVSALIFRPISGMFSDSFNRKIIILCTSFITAVCMVLYSMATSVNFLVGVRLVHGIVFSFSGVAMMAFNTSFIPRSRLSEGMGWMALGSIISNSIGPNMGLWLVNNVGYGACFLAAAGANLLTMLMILLIPYESPAKKKLDSRRFDINNLISLRILPYAILTGLFSMGNGLVNSFLTLLGDERNIPNVAVFFTAYSIVMVVSRPLAGRLQDKRGIKIILYPAYAIAAAGMILLGNAMTSWMIVAAAVLKALGQGSGAPAIQSHCLKMMGKEKAGVVSSTCYIGQDIGNAIAPPLGAMVATQFGYRTMFTSYAVLLLVVGWVMFTIKSRYDERKYGTN